MSDKVERKVNEQLFKDNEDQRRSMQMLVGVAFFLVFAIIGMTVLIVIGERKHKKAEESKRQERINFYHDHNFNAGELARVSNMKPLYLVKERSR